MKKNLFKEALEGQEESRRKQVADEVLRDFERRRSERRQIELGWQLNLNFVLGNQFVGISNSGEIEDDGRDYFWQEREVFNHLAPIIETRLAKLNRVRPIMKVVPFSGDDDDVFVAKMSTSILKAAHNRLELNNCIKDATMWSEVTGTAFYKVIWNTDSGSELKDGVREGDVEVCACPPFEIFPDNISAQGIAACRSIIHARAMNVGEVSEAYNIDATGQSIDMFSFESGSMQGGLGYSTMTNSFKRTQREDVCLVLERYTMPSKRHKNGRLEIVAAGVLVHEGDLPYVNMRDGERGLPFVRQVSIESPHCFYGASVLDRCIPIQRAFNAVKNRKHEFINRLAMGVLTVEDGSVDTDNLETEGLSPGKVLIYRQGANPPSMMDMGRVPSELAFEEDRLLNEFTHISGVSEVMRNSAVPSQISSGVALQLLIEQDDTRLSVTAEIIRNAIKQVSQHILRLYKQFAANKRLARIAGENGVEVFYWNRSDLGCDDIDFVTENEMNETPASKRSMVFDLLNAGLLHDENGKLSNAMRAKVLDLLGYGLWETAQDVAALHIKRACAENIELSSKGINPLIIDDHEIHLREHTKHLLSGELADDGHYPHFYEHIQAHKTMLAQSLNQGEQSNEEVSIGE